MITVVGSVNRDLILTTEALPGPGETVLGSSHLEAPGGKGANQAVAAARLGAEVAFVGRVGDDDAGRMLAAALEEAGVDTTYLVPTGLAPSGLAVITVDGAGENTIVVSPGANALVGVSDVADAESLLRSSSVTLLQLEIPIRAVADAASTAGGTVLLNAAPAQQLPKGLLSETDVIVVNQSELETLAGSTDPSAASRLGVPTAVVTLGPGGAALVIDGEASIFPAPEVDVLDTTGAGDTFCGALAAGIDAGLSIADVLPRAVAAGALATTAVGARSAMPTAQELNTALRTQGS